MLFFCNCHFFFYLLQDLHMLSLLLVPHSWEEITHPYKANTHNHLPVQKMCSQQLPDTPLPPLLAQATFNYKLGINAKPPHNVAQNYAHFYEKSMHE